MGVPRALTAALLAILLPGCAELMRAVESLDQTLQQTIPEHPVTGRGVANLVSQAVEIQAAEQGHVQLVEAAKQEGAGFDPPGERRRQIQRVFDRLVAVSHRQDLPWQVHLIDHEMVNAMTPGGGYVYVFEGLFGTKGLVRNGDDDELAAVLAHEIAHVTMLHMAIDRTDQMLSDRAKSDPFYSASFSTEQEAEADKASVLYMALAGYDPRAGERVWERAHRRLGSNPGFYLYDHPLNAQRIAIVRDAAAEVVPFYTPGQQNPRWAFLLENNPLFPRVQRAEGTGSGIGKAIEAYTEGASRHERAKEEAERREELARRTPEFQSSLVRILQTTARPDQWGQPQVYMQFHNGASYPTAAIGVTVIYVDRAQRALAHDPNCGGPARIEAGQTVWLWCPMHQVQGAANYQVQITGVEFGR